MSGFLLIFWNTAFVVKNEYSKKAYIYDDDHKSKVRCQESFIRKYTYKEYMELSLDIIIQYSLIKQRHGEHLDVTMAPEKPGRHQPYFESWAHTDFVREQPPLEGPQRPVTAEEAPEPGTQK